MFAAVALLATLVGISERHEAPRFAALAGVARPLAPGVGGASGAWLPTVAARARPPRRQERIGFYMPWDVASERSLAAHVADLDWVAAGLATVEGTAHRWHYAPDPHLRRLMRARPDRLLLMIQNVSGKGVWEGGQAARLFADPRARAALVARVEAAVLAERAGGALLDIEDLPVRAHDDYRHFLGQLRARLAARGLRVAIAAPVADPAWDLAAYARIADRVVLMAYDQHWPGGAPGPIAAQPWYVETLARAVEAVGPERAIVGIGNYAYDWEAGAPSATPLTVAEAWSRASAADTMPLFDRPSGNSRFAYVRAGRRHDVWMLDAISAWNQIRVARTLDVAGVALWRLGSEDPGIWAVLAAPSATVPDIASLPGQDGVELVGQGEVLRLARTASPGRRTVQTDDDGLIRSARYDALPGPARVERAGNARRRVALTFDDGPDPRWTPRILDILRDHHAPATFFVTGANALGQSALLNRIVRQGSELGNHSATHSDLDRLPEAAIRLELNATQRLVESYTGRSMRLFRAPYLGDADPSTPGELRAARIASEMGYLSVGLNVDPRDWTARDPRAIVADTVAQVEGGTATRATRIILLHDSGGDRSATIAALPGIIRELRARGYDFATVSDLAGIPADAAMPVLRGTGRASAEGAGALFGGVAWLDRTVAVLFVVAIAIGMARAILLTGLAWHGARRAPPPAPSPHLVPRFVSVLIPAYNEARVIEASVARVLSSEGSRVEVIVIDDGSTDGTAAIVSRAFGIDPRVTLLALSNGGKARALNHGLAIARGDIVISLDADTQFEGDTIARLARWFADPAVGAVAGNARVGNVVNLVTRWQAIEYVTAQQLERRALAAIDAVTVVPGAVGAWRRTALDAVGGYPSDTLAEDQDLTIAIQRAGWRVACDTEATAWTEAPDTVARLFRQRYRWAFGTLQCLWKHRRAIRDDRRHGIALFGMPQAWLFQIGFGLLSPIIDLALVASLIGAGLRLLNHGYGATAGDLGAVLAFWTAFAAVDVACGWIAYRLDGRAGRFPALLLLMQRFGYRQILYAVVVRAVLAALAGPRVAWGKLERSGAVRLAGPPPCASPSADNADIAFERAA